MSEDPNIEYLEPVLSADGGQVPPAPSPSPSPTPTPTPRLPADGNRAPGGDDEA